MDSANTNKKEEFYQSLKTKLEDHHQFPENYLFKFIIPNDQEKLSSIYSIFDELKHTITTRESKNEKYLSVSINAFVLDANHVIEIYQKVAEIEGVIML